MIKLCLLVARQGFEPRHSDPESDVLPLYYRAMECKYSFFYFFIEPLHGSFYNPECRLVKIIHCPNGLVFYIIASDKIIPC